MPREGPGPYGDIALDLLLKVKADAVIILVGGGSRGSGYSVAAEPRYYPQLIEALRNTLEQIESEMKANAPS